MRSSAGPRSLLAAGILVCICLLSRAPGAECTAPLEDRTLQELTLYLPKSALPGQTVGFTLGTWECCVFIVPVPACAGWTLEPPEAGTVTLLSEPPHPFGRSGQLELSPSLPHGTVVTLTADVESGRRVLSAALHVYTPEANPLVGYWTEKSQLTCPGFIRGELDRNGKLEITDANRERMMALNASLNALIDEEVCEDRGQMLPGGVEAGWEVTPETMAP